MTLAQCKVTTQTVSCIDHACFQVELNGGGGGKQIQNLLRDIKVLQSVTSVTSGVPDHYLVTEPALFSPRPSRPLELLQSGFQLFLSFSKFLSLLL